MGKQATRTACRAPGHLPSLASGGFNPPLLGSRALCSGLTLNGLARSGTVTSRVDAVLSPTLGRPQNPAQARLSLALSPQSGMTSRKPLTQQRLRAVVLAAGVTNSP
jgi:hypothetical protein